MKHLLIAMLTATISQYAFSENPRPTPPLRDIAEAKYDASTNVTTLDISLSYNNISYRLATRWRGKPYEAISAHQKRSGWKDSYFFVRDDCLDKKNWRCSIEHVFTFIPDKAGSRLAYLGSVETGEDCIEEAKFGCALFDDVFTDIYDRLEKNILVDRSESPALLIEMRNLNGKFVVDLDETWGRNQERFAAGKRCLSATPPSRKEDCANGITPIGALMFNAALSHYTKRNADLADTKKFAKSILCERVAESDCQEAIRSFEFILAGVIPGELARPDGHVKELIETQKE